MEIHYFLALITVLQFLLLFCHRRSVKAYEHLPAVVLAFLFAAAALGLHSRLANSTMPAVLSMLALRNRIQTPLNIAWAMNIMLVGLFLLLRPLFKRLWSFILKRAGVLQPLYPGYYRHNSQIYLLHRLAGSSVVLRWSGAAAAAFFLLLHFGSNHSVIWSALLYPWAPFLIVILELACYLGGTHLQLREAGAILAGPVEAAPTPVFDGIYHRYTTHFSPFMLDKRIYRKSFPEQRPEALERILDQHNLLITDTYNDRVLPSLLDIIDMYLKQGGQIIITAAGENLLTELHAELQLQQRLRPLSMALIVGPNIRSQVRDGELYDVILLRTDLFEELQESDNFEDLCPHLQLIIAPYVTEQGLEAFASVDHVFSHSDMIAHVRFVIIGEKYAHIEETVKRIYHLPAVTEVQTISQKNYKRYLVLWEAEPDTYYHESLIGGANFVPPPTILSIAPSHAGLREIIWLKNGPFEKDSIETLRGNLRTSSQIPEFAQAEIDPQSIKLLRGYKIFDQSPQRFIFIFDDMQNLPFLLHYLDKHDRAEADFVNILSPRYMLRSYFIANLDALISTPHSEKLLPVITWPEDSVKGTLFSLFRMLRRAHSGIPVERLQRMFFYDQALWSKISRLETFSLSRSFLARQMAAFADLQDDAPNLIENYQWDADQGRMSKFIALKGVISSPDFTDYFSFIDADTGERIVVDQNISRDNLAYLYKLKDQIAVRNPAWSYNDIKYFAIRSIDYQAKLIRAAHTNPDKPNRHICAVDLRINNDIQLTRTQLQRGDSSTEMCLHLLNYQRKITHLLLCTGYTHFRIEHCTIDTAPASHLPDEIVEREFAYVYALQYRITARSLAGKTSRIAYTLTVLIKQLLASFFPQAHAQLHLWSPQAAVLLSERENSKIDRILRLMQPNVEGAPADEPAETVELWIIEESEIGLGVVKYLERNMQWLWDVLNDYLHFHLESEIDDDFLFWGLRGDDRAAIPYDFPGTLAAVDIALGDLDHSLYEERKRRHTIRNIEALPCRYEEDQVACDFCAREIKDVVYSILSDGRVRCGSCSDSEIKGIHELRQLWEQARAAILKLFHVAIPQVENLELHDANYIQSQLGLLFHPTRQYDARAVGLALIENAAGTVHCRLIIENGAPKWNAYLSIVHELTHLWQHLQLETTQIPGDVLEGHASYVEYRVLEATAERRNDPLLQQQFVRLQARAASKEDAAARFLAELIERKQNPFALMIHFNGGA